MDGEEMIKFFSVVFGLLLSVGSIADELQLYFVHNDHLGTPVVVTDSAQTVVWQAEKTPFGETTETINSIEQPLRFPGQYFDRETGLHYNYFRDYDPGLGRYVQSDPIGLAGGINTYGYVGGNPVVYFDPYGLASQYSGGVSANGAFFLGGNLSFTAGISVPDNRSSWRCYQFFINGSGGATAGVGAYVGAGGTFSAGSTSGPLPDWGSMSANRYWEASGGWGPSLGYSQQGATDMAGASWEDVFSGDAWDSDLLGSEAVAGKFGVGFGLYAGLGYVSNFLFATPTFGDDCECQ